MGMRVRQTIERVIAATINEVCSLVGIAKDTQSDNDRFEMINMAELQLVDNLQTSLPRPPSVDPSPGGGLQPHKSVPWMKIGDKLH